MYHQLLTVTDITNVADIAEHHHTSKKASQAHLLPANVVPRTRVHFALSLDVDGGHRLFLHLAVRGLRHCEGGGVLGCGPASGYGGRRCGAVIVSALLLLLLS